MRRDERGMSISVFTAVAMPAIILAMGVGVDFAGHAAATQEARDVARQAARAATHEIRVDMNGDPQVNSGAAGRAVEQFAAAAGWQGRLTYIDAGRAVVEVTGRYGTIFLGIIGIDTMAVSGSGTARALPVLDGTVR